jgi:hypothetical protein
MKMTKMVKGKWTNEHIELSKTLGHYEKYDILELARFPAYYSMERLRTEMINNEQVLEMINNKIPMLQVNVGSYRSILISRKSF